MWSKKYHITFNYEEYRLAIKCLIELKNSLISEGKYTDAVDDVLCKLVSAKKSEVNS